MDDNLNVVGFITVEKRIESLETAVKDLKLTLNKILEFMEAYTNEKDA
jgi:hypothetical protein